MATHQANAGHIAGAVAHELLADQLAAQETQRVSPR